jgi:hypothetical protein
MLFYFRIAPPIDTNSKSYFREDSIFLGEKNLNPFNDIQKQARDRQMSRTTLVSVVIFLSFM